MGRQEEIKALVFAAGLGTRLRPLTDTMPKALVQVGGQPLLYHVLTKLRDAGISGAVVNVHHFAEQIIDYLSAHDFGMPVQISDERDLLRETGGALLHARPLLGNKPFLVHNVDILSNLDIPAFCAAARPGALATLLVSERETQRYLLFDDDMRMKGWINVATGEVRSPYPALDVAACRRLAFDGIHFLSPEVFDAFARYGFEGRFPIMDFYIRACADYPVCACVQPGLTMMDIGKVGSLAAAEEFIRNLQKFSYL